MNTHILGKTPDLHIIHSEMPRRGITQVAVPAIYTFPLMQFYIGSYYPFAASYNILDCPLPGTNGMIKPSIW